MPRRRRRPLTVRLCALAVVGCALRPEHETLGQGRFEHLELIVPRSPKSVVLLLSGRRDHALADALTPRLARDGALVTRVDTDAFAAVLRTSDEPCATPAGDLENLAHFVQAYAKLPSYQPAILVGVGTGAALAGASAMQAPEGTFAGALVGRACVDEPALARLCPPAPEAPATVSAQPEARVTSMSALDSAACGGARAGPPASRAKSEELQRRFRDLAGSARRRSVVAPDELSDLPLVEVPATGDAPLPTFAVLLSGDGGWAGLDARLSRELAARGVSVVGVDSLRYFWHARTPEGTARDVERVIQRYRAVWRKPRVVLVGYSQGADVLPFIVNRLRASTREALAGVVAFGPSSTATFEFHLRDWGGAEGDEPTLPEMQRLAHRSVVCVHGREESDSLCPRLDGSAFHVVAVPGGHHFGADYHRLATIVLDAAGVGASPHE